MEILEKANILAKAGEYDSCGPKSCQIKMEKGLGGIYNAKSENKNCRLLKTVMDNNCSQDCKYCPNANHKAKQKASFEPKELASLFNYLVKEQDIHGLFLSSGIPKDPNQQTEKMLQTVKLLRFNYNYHGYIHFKILPGTNFELVKQASELCQRLSVNIEAPNQSILSELSTTKDYQLDIIKRQKWIKYLKPTGGQTTQLIVTQETTDKEIIKSIDWQYKELEIKRLYFSAFKPIKDTPLENKEKCPEHRQNHLYNIDFLLRQYNFKIEEFNPILKNDFLPNEDPKLALAKSLEIKDINELTYEELLRIPGIGPKTAKKIKERKIKDNKQLYSLGKTTKRSLPFIKLNNQTQSKLSNF